MENEIENEDNWNLQELVEEVEVSEWFFMQNDIDTLHKKILKDLDELMPDNDLKTNLKNMINKRFGFSN